MRTYSVVLIDDEHLALQLLENFCARLPDLEVKGRFSSPDEALDYLHREQVDFLFLDIQMPRLSGLNLLRSLPNPPVTIFTTAYQEHAVEAYNLNVVDYLLKPFAFERFVQAVGKARAHLLRHSTAPAAQPAYREAALPTAAQCFVCKVDGRLEKIPFEEIVVVEGMREYVKIIGKQRNYITLESMKNMETALPSDQFVRVHKSYIVAKSNVQNMEGNMLNLGKIKVPVSREKKEDIIKAIFGI
jgi:two-component system, LytTR family, response regulator LytT